ncbi:MAG: hypothetical protein R2849_18350 [Thermomicrobiales bacterium]
MGIGDAIENADLVILAVPPLAVKEVMWRQLRRCFERRRRL